MNTKTDQTLLAADVLKIITYYGTAVLAFSNFFSTELSLPTAPATRPSELMELFPFPARWSGPVLHISASPTIPVPP